TAPS
ncbi:D-lactate dehydrogenase, partial [Vibrio harveyi]